MWSVEILRGDDIHMQDMQGVYSCKVYDVYRLSSFLRVELVLEMRCEYLEFAQLAVRGCVCISMLRRAAARRAGVASMAI